MESFVSSSEPLASMVCFVGTVCLCWVWAGVAAGAASFRGAGGRAMARRRRAALRGLGLPCAHDRLRQARGAPSSFENPRRAGSRRRDLSRSDLGRGRGCPHDLPGGLANI